MKNKITLIATLIFFKSFGQDPFWKTTGNTINGLGDRFVGTTDQASLRFKTDGILRAAFPYNNSITNYGGGGGNGLRIFNVSAPTNPSGVLDLFTTPGNKTHVGFSNDGCITGAAGRMEYYASGTGFWFNALGGRAIWTINGNENARMGVNTYWHFGTSGVDAARRVEIQDGSPQLRLTNTNNYAEFYAKANGRLLIMPNGTNTGFTNNINYNPTERIDVEGTARFRIVPGTTTPNSLIVGVNNGGAGDITLHKLDFNGNANQVLLGNGTWGTVGSVSNAHNGLSISTIDPTKIAFGQDPFTAFDPGRLITDREIPLNKKYVHFSDREIADVGYVGIGSTFAPDFRIKFSIYNDTLRTSQSIRTFSYSGSYIPDRTSLVATTMHANQLTGIFGQTIGAKTIAYAIRGRSLSNEIFVQSLGAYFEGLGDNQLENNGVRGFAKNSAKLNIGGKFAAMNDNPNESSYNIGVYGEATGLPSAAGYFVGNVVTTGSSLWLSDSTYKDSIVTIGENLDSLFNELHPVSFKFNEDAQEKLNTGSDVKLGFLAQEVGNVYPWLVKDVILPAEYDTTGVEVRPESTYKAVDVTQLIPLLVSVTQKNNQTITVLANENQQQQSEIDSLTDVVGDLNNRLTALENCLSALLPTLCSMNQSMIESNTPAQQQELRSQLAVTLSTRNAIVLDQNVPNPFAEQTVINFSIPATVLKAQIHFYDGNGKLIQSVDIAERGSGSLNVFGSDLSKGIYTYTLVADGQIVATKKMIKE